MKYAFVTALMFLALGLPGAKFVPGISGKALDGRSPLAFDPARLTPQGGSALFWFKLSDGALPLKRHAMLLGLGINKHAVSDHRGYADHRILIPQLKGQTVGLDSLQVCSTGYERKVPFIPPVGGDVQGKHSAEVASYSAKSHDYYIIVCCAFIQIHLMPL